MLNVNYIVKYTKKKYMKIIGNDNKREFLISIIPSTLLPP